MAQTLKQLRDELANRLGFGGQGGTQEAQRPILTSMLQRSQQAIISEFGEMLPGTVYPPNPFEDDDDLPSVPESGLFLRALVLGKIHYRQPADAAANEWRNYEAGARGLVAQ